MQDHSFSFVIDASPERVWRALHPPVRNPAQDQEDEKAKRASIEKWEAFCKPKRTYDDEGVVRLLYARKGCEFGRSE